MSRFNITYVVLLLSLGGLPVRRLFFQTQPTEVVSHPVQVQVPDPDIGADTLQARKQAQMATVNQFKVFYQFHFVQQGKRERHHLPV